MLPIIGRFVRCYDTLNCIYVLHATWYYSLYVLSLHTTLVVGRLHLIPMSSYKQQQLPEYTVLDEQRFKLWLQRLENSFKVSCVRTLRYYIAWRPSYLHHIIFG